jgi:hypothetical protein
VRLSGSKDTRFFLAGVAASLALVAYLAVAFANTHASIAAANRVAPWTPYHAKLIPVRRGTGRGYDVHVNPTSSGTYGSLVPALVSHPAAGRSYVVGFWLKGSRGGSVGVAIDEFSPGASSVYVVNTTVPVTPKWHHFTFSPRVKGTWLGLGMFVSRQTESGRSTRFALRGLTVGLGRR